VAGAPLPGRVRLDGGFVTGRRHRGCPACVHPSGGTAGRRRDRTTAGCGPAERGPAERGPAERGPVERGPAERGPAGMARHLGVHSCARLPCDGSVLLRPGSRSLCPPPHYGHRGRFRSWKCRLASCPGSSPGRARPAGAGHGMAGLMRCRACSDDSGDPLFRRSRDRGPRDRGPRVRSGQSGQSGPSGRRDLTRGASG